MFLLSARKAPAGGGGEVGLEGRGKWVRNNGRKKEGEKKTRKRRLLDIPLSWTQWGLAVTPGKCGSLNKFIFVQCAY